jgi:hypothetical protein
VGAWRTGAKCEYPANTCSDALSTVPWKRTIIGALRHSNTDTVTARLSIYLFKNPSQPPASRVRVSAGEHHHSISTSHRPNLHTHPIPPHRPSHRRTVPFAGQPQTDPPLKPSTLSPSVVRPDSLECSVSIKRQTPRAPIKRSAHPTKPRNNEAFRDRPASGVERPLPTGLGTDQWGIHGSRVWCVGRPSTVQARRGSTVEVGVRMKKGNLQGDPSSAVCGRHLGVRGANMCTSPLKGPLTPTIAFIAQRQQSVSFAKADEMRC